MKALQVVAVGRRHASSEEYDDSALEVAFDAIQRRAMMLQAMDPEVAERLRTLATQLDAKMLRERPRQMTAKGARFGPRSSSVSKSEARR